MTQQEQIAEFVDEYLESRRAIGSHATAESSHIAPKATQQLGFKVTIDDINQVLEARKSQGSIQLAYPIDSSGNIVVTFP